VVACAVVACPVVACTVAACTCRETVMLGKPDGAGAKPLGLNGHLDQLRVVVTPGATAPGQVAAVHV
jgi:hypothetical protein